MKPLNIQQPAKEAPPAMTPLFPFNDPARGSTRVISSPGEHTATKARCVRAKVVLWLAGLIVSGGLLWSGCAGPSLNRSTDQVLEAGPEVQVGPEAEAEAFRAIVATLADPTMQGRGAGTQGLDRARDEIVQRFSALGLRPAFVRHPDGQTEAAAFTQPFQINLDAKVEHQSLTLVAGGKETDLTAQASRSYNALGLSASAAFEGPAVFVGYGIQSPEHQYDSYAHAPEDAVHGKVVIAFRYEPQDQDGRSLWVPRDDAHGAGRGPWTNAASLLNKAKWAADHGAVALLVVNPPSQDRGDLKSTSRSVASSQAPIPVIHIRSTLFEQMLARAGRPPQVIRIYQDRADRGDGVYDSLDGLVVRGRVALEHPTARIANVAGVLDGTGGLADQFIVIGAHYDHLGFGQIGSLAPNHSRQVHPGADDNASGTAGLLLLADRLTRHVAGQPMNHRDPAHPADPSAGHRSVLFAAFSGEERGLLGSAYLMGHLEDLGLASEQMVAMINLDMIGRMVANDLYVMGVGSGDRWQSLLDDAISVMNLTLHTQPKPFGGSDHISFHVRGVPALHIFTGVHSDYHRPTDTIDKINATGAIRAIDLIEAVTERLLVQQPKMAFVAESLDSIHAMTGWPPSVNGSEGSPSAGSFNVYLGVLPDYATLDSQDGCGVTMVMPKSPAQAAGLRGGDVITAWNGQPLPNVRALSEQLRIGQPGESVKLIVRRDGQLIELTAVLGHRS